MIDVNNTIEPTKIITYNSDLIISWDSNIKWSNTVIKTKDLHLKTYNDQSLHTKFLPII